MDPDPDLDPSIIMQNYFGTLFDFLSLKKDVNVSLKKVISRRNK
jgi:hypothetical protein